MEIWHIPAKGGRARLVRSVTTAASLDLNVLSFSSDLGFVAYLQERGAEGETPEEMESWLEVRRLGTEDVMASPEVTRLFGWAPDSRHFAYLRGGEAPQLGIGQWSGRGYRGSVETGKAVVTLDWLDVEHYLVVAGQRAAREPGGGSFSLVLADISGSSTVLAESTDLLAYDFVLGHKMARD
jgi:hypothetical protein